MRLLFPLCATAAALAVVGTVSAQSAGPTYADVGLTWVRMPSLKDMARLYPVRARASGYTRGQATLGCTPDHRGRLACEVLRESPQNSRFGEAGLNVMRAARVAAVDGGSPAGRRFVYTLKFGNWRGSNLPLRYHPTQAGLRWVQNPELKDNWNMAGQGPGQVYSASFSCVAHADGSLDCQVRDVAPNVPRYAEAALKSMEAATVRRADGGSPEGVRFDWTLRAMNQSQCTGRTRSGDVGGGADVDTSAGGGGGSGGAPGAGGELFGGALATGMGTCIARLVQLH